MNDPIVASNTYFVIDFIFINHNSSNNVCIISWFRIRIFIFDRKWCDGYELLSLIMTDKVSDQITRFQYIEQGYRFRTVPASTIGIYHTGQQSGTLDPPVSYRKKYRAYRPCTGQFRAIPAGTGRTGRYRKKFLFYFLFLFYF